MNANFSPFPVLVTKNLVLRRLTMDDVPDVFNMRRDPLMHLHTDTKPDSTAAETAAYIEKMNRGVEQSKWIIWAMELKGLETGLETGLEAEPDARHGPGGQCAPEQATAPGVIGTISIWNLDAYKESGELGFGIIPSYQGKGLMREALESVERYGFDVMGLRLLEAWTEAGNARALGLLKRCGFVEVDRVDEPGTLCDRLYHMVVMRKERCLSETAHDR